MPSTRARASTFANYFGGFSTLGVSSTEVPSCSTGKPAPSTGCGRSLWIRREPAAGRRSPGRPGGRGRGEVAGVTGLVAFPITARGHNRRRALVSMSHKGPSVWSVLMTLPTDPVVVSDPGNLVIRPPRQVPSKLASRRTDLRLRPIPLSPEGVRGREFYVLEAQPRKGFARKSRHSSGSGVSPTGSPGLLHRSELDLHSLGKVLWTCGQSRGGTARPVRSCGFPRTPRRPRAAAGRGRAAATIWTPTGRPSGVVPAGTEIAGQPVTVTR